MPRDNATTFADLRGKLDVLRVTCAKCDRAGRYRLDRLIDQRGAVVSRVIGSVASAASKLAKLSKHGRRRYLGLCPGGDSCCFCLVAYQVLAKLRWANISKNITAFVGSNSIAREEHPTWSTN
jgi:hypothetical protein